MRLCSDVANSTTLPTGSMASSAPSPTDCERPSLKGKLEDLERRKAELETILSQPEPPAPRRHPNLSELYRQKDEALHEAFADPEIRTEAIEILRDLIDRIALYPITEPSPNR